MNKKRHTFLMLLSVLAILILCIGVLCACKKEEISYSIMLPSGEHYTVTSNNIVMSKRGGKVVFDVTIEDGYVLYSTSSGIYANSKLVIDNIKYDMTIIFDVRKKANISYDTPNAKVEIKSNTNSELCVGEKALITAAANENYNLESLTINDVVIDIVPVFGGLHSQSLEIILEENMIVVAKTLGDEYSFKIECDINRGVYTIDRDSKDEKYRYGDNITIKTQAIAPNYFGYYDYNGQLFTDDLPLQFTINGATEIKINFYNDFEKRIIYHPNGGIIANNAFPDILYTAGEYVNIDHCYNKITRDGYTLVGLREGLDGEIHRLGAMAKIPKANLELYAIWEEWTDSSYFLSEAIDDKTCKIVGYRPNIGTISLTRLIIPEMIGERKVVEIDSNAFKNNQYLQEIVFNNNLATVGENAFANCPELVKIMIFESMINKNKSAFANCPKFTTCEINAMSAPDHRYSYEASIAERWNELTRPGRGKKIILISGSSGTFGIDTDLFLKEYPTYEPLLFAVHAGMGIRPLLNIVEKHVKPGDIIILSPEYEPFMYAKTEESTFLNHQYLQKNYDITADINILDNPMTLHLTNEFFKSKTPGGPYSPNYSEDLLVGKYGAIVSPTRYNLYTPSKIDLIRKSIFDETSKVIFRRFSNSVVGKGAKVYFSFPPLCKETITGNAMSLTYRQEFVDMLKDGFNYNGMCFLPIISNIEDYIMDTAYFYDTAFHLTNVGASVRTTQLIKDINAQLAKEVEL